MKDEDENKALSFPVTVVYGMDIEAKDKTTIKNFCEDYEILGVPEDKYLALPIAVIDEIAEGDPEGTQIIFKGPVRVSNFTLYTEKGDLGTMLMVEYESDLMQKYFEVIADMYENIDHDPELTFVLSYDYEGGHDLDNLSYHFNRYLPIITASGDISGVYDDAETDAILLGYKEITED